MMVDTACLVSLLRPATSRSELYLIERYAATSHLLELARRHPGDAAELGTQMGRTRIVELVGNLCNGELIVDQQFLDSFNLLQNAVALNGDTAIGRKSIAQGGIIAIELGGDIL